MLQPGTAIVSAVTGVLHHGVSWGALIQMHYASQISLGNRKEYESRLKIMAISRTDKIMVINHGQDPATGTTLQYIVMPPAHRA